jgi:hypothetical protein
MQAPDVLWQDVGGYTEVDFGITKEWDVATRMELWRRLDNEDSYERLPFGFGVFKALVSGSYMPSHFSRVRLQYSFEHLIDDLLYDEDGLPSNAGEPVFSNNNHTVMLQLEVSAGSHGAHKY